MQTFRISIPGYNALTETDKTKYSIRADEDNVLIKEHSRGTGTFTETVSIAHNLGYIPFFLMYGEISSGRYRLNSFYDVQGGGWRVRANTTSLNIDNPAFDANSDGYRYYIFYDELI